MTVEELKRELTKQAKGAAFIRPGEIADFMNQTKTQNVRKYYRGLPKNGGAYFIPDVAKNIFEMADWS